MNPDLPIARDYQDCVADHPGELIFWTSQPQDIED